jgi:signal-transduction protein with cAMP-binding, CBS, and nucleotidyltransferase domain
MECLRIDEIISNPDLAKYLITFTSGQTIFLEGDDSQDLYILVAGQVEIFKGDMKIRDITEEGTVFGSKDKSGSYLHSQRRDHALFGRMSNSGTGDHPTFITSVG